MFGKVEFSIRKRHRFIDSLFEEISLGYINNRDIFAIIMVISDVGYELSDEVC